MADAQIMSERRRLCAIDVFETVWILGEPSAQKISIKSGWSPPAVKSALDQLIARGEIVCLKGSGRPFDPDRYRVTMTEAARVAAIQQQQQLVRGAA